MPITIEASTSAVLKGSLEGRASSRIQEDKVEPEQSFLLSGSITHEGPTLLYDTSIESSGSSNLSNTPDRDLKLSLTNVFLDEFSQTILVDFEFNKDVFLRLAPANVPAFLSDLNRFVAFNTIDVFDVHLQNIPLFLIEKSSESIQVLNLESNEEVSASGNLVLEDVIGPVVRNELPLSGSRLNDPNSEITFDLIDDATGVRQSSIQVSVNNVGVVENGSPLTVSGFGQSFLTKVSDNLFQFRFIKDTPFTLKETVVVSGFAEDLETPSNSGNFLYDFTIWDYRDLMGEITPGPDILPPYLINQVPSPGQIQVDPNFNITLEIADDHTGVDGSSVTIEVDGNIVVESGVTVEDFANTTITPLPSIRGFRYEIDPLDTLPFFHIAVVDVYAQDLFVISGSPNVLDESYSFLTTSNQHLVVSGLSVLEDDYQLFYPEESADSSEPTSFRVIYRDLTLSGIDLNNSHVYHNEQQISGVTFTPVVSGSEDAYFVDFDLEPFYFGESNLRFRTTQVFSGAVLGSVAPFRDVHMTLQWGYKICYSPEEEFEYGYEVEYCVRICDRGDYPKRDSFCSSFETVPYPSKALTARITGIELDPTTLLSSTYTANNTFFEYGKTMNLEIEVKDLSGNTLIFPWSFTIEDQE